MGEPPAVAEAHAPSASPAAAADSGRRTPAAMTPPAHLEFGDLSLAAAGAQTLLEQWQRAQDCEQGVRAGEDPEAVHKMRVALRRFRAAAQVFGKAVDRALGEPVTDQLAEDAAAVAGPLGRVRDLDVFIAYLQRETQRAPTYDLIAIERLIERRREERAAAREAAQAALEGPEMQHLRDSVAPRLAPLAACQHQNGKRRTAGRCAPKLVARRLRRLRRLDDTLTVPRPEDLHRVRICAKKWRYAAEFFAPAFPEGLAPIVETATQIQDALGEVHDLDVLGATFLGDVERVALDPIAAKDAASIARLIRRGHEQRDAALARFRTLWAALPRPGALRKQVVRSGAKRRKETGGWRTPQ